MSLVKFKFYSTKSAYQTDKDAGNIDTGDIIAISDTQEIIIHEVSINASEIDTNIEDLQTQVNSLSNSALQSISKGTDGSYVTTTVGDKSSNTQTVAVSVTTVDLEDATSSNNGLATAYDVVSYLDSVIGWEEHTA